MSKKIIIIGTLALILGAGTKFYTSPMSTLSEIEEGFKTKNADLVSKNVDYDTLQKSIKEQMLLKIATEQKNSPTKGFEAIGAMMGAKIIENMINTHVTKSGLKKAMAKNSKKMWENLTAKGKFVDFETYAVTLHKKEKGDIHAVLKRVGLFSWKVTDIELPEKL